MHKWKLFKKSAALVTEFSGDRVRSAGNGNGV